MNSLRIILIGTGVIFVIGIYLFQSRASLLKNKKQSSDTFIIHSFNILLQIISIAFKRLKYFLRWLFDTKENVKDKFPRRQKRPQQKLSNEQLDSMNDLVANNATSKSTSEQSNINIYSDNARSVNPASVEHVQSMPVAKGTELLITFTILPKFGTVFSGADILAACKLAGLQFGEFNIFHRYSLVNDKVIMTPVCSLLNLFEPGFFDLSAMDNFTTEGLSLFMQLPGPVDGRDAFVILMDVSDKLSTNLNATICDETRSVLTTQTISHIKEKVENFRFKLKMDALKNH